MSDNIKRPMPSTRAYVWQTRQKKDIKPRDVANAGVIPRDERTAAVLVSAVVAEPSDVLIRELVLLVAYYSILGTPKPIKLVKAIGPMHGPWWPDSETADARYLVFDAPDGILNDRTRRGSKPVIAKYPNCIKKSRDKMPYSNTPYDVLDRDLINGRMYAIPDPIYDRTCLEYGRVFDKLSADVKGYTVPIVASGNAQNVKRYSPRDGMYRTVHHERRLAHGVARRSNNDPCFDANGRPVAWRARQTRAHKHGRSLLLARPLGNARPLGKRSKG